MFLMYGNSCLVQFSQPSQHSGFFLPHKPFILWHLSTIRLQLLSLNGLQISMNALITRHCVLMTTSDVLTCQGHIDVIAEMVTIVSMESVKVNTHLYSNVCTYT